MSKVSNIRTTKGEKMKTRNTIVGLSIALSLGVASMANAAALIGKAVEAKSAEFEKFKADKSGEILEVYKNKASVDSLKTETAKRILSDITEVNKANAQKTSVNQLKAFALTHKGVDTVATLSIISKEITRLQGDVKTAEDKAELASLQSATATIAEFVDTIGGSMLVSADPNKPTPPLAKEALEKVIEILPNIMVKFESAQRAKYVQVLADMTAKMRTGLAPADALRAAINDDAKLEALKGCKL
jgi:hypothetical protein